MEEESERRKERLKALRTHSSSSSSISQQTLNLSSPLANPLLDNNNTSQSPTPRPRFGYYTDPMAAFSSDKRPSGPPFRPHFSPSSLGPRNSEMPLSGFHQFQNSPAPNQSFNQSGDPFFRPRSFSSPMRVGSPYPVHHGGDPSYGPGPPGPPTGSMGFRGPNAMYQGNPSFTSAPGRGQQYNNSSGPASGHGSSSPPVFQASPTFRSPQEGRGPWFNNTPNPGRGIGGSPSPSVGRGRGVLDGSRMSPDSRHSGGRGRGRGHHGSAQAGSYYDRSMVEDPWDSLTPVVWRRDPWDSSTPAVWRRENNRVSFSNNCGSILMNSSAKKARVSNTSNTSSNTEPSGPSLAEFLAAAVDEAVGDDAAAD